MEELDRRVKRTRRLLGDALVSLILEKGYDAITVKEITKRADVAHATFYRHYRDKDELLARRLEEVIAELEDLAQEPALHNADGYLIFKHVQENSVLYRILFSSQGTTHVRKRVRERIAANNLATCASLQQAVEAFISADIAANHMAASLLSLIEWWLEHDMPHPPYHMAQIYHRLILEATVQTAVGEVAAHQ
jgi:AcrR family transcriptional regulator